MGSAWLFWALPGLPGAALLRSDLWRRTRHCPVMRRPISLEFELRFASWAYPRISFASGARQLLPSKLSGGPGKMGFGSHPGQAAVCLCSIKPRSCSVNDSGLILLFLTSRRCARGAFLCGGWEAPGLWEYGWHFVAVFHPSDLIRPAQQLRRQIDHRTSHCAEAESNKRCTFRHNGDGG